MNFVSSFVEAEHDRLDKLFAAVLAELKNLEKAITLFEEFKNQLVRHMRMEDVFLFPRLNDYLKMDGDIGLAAQAHAEHAVIRKLIFFVDQAGQTNNLKKFRISAKNLGRSLEKHRTRERKLQYPVSDRFISEREWNLILRKVYGLKEKIKK